MKNKFLAIILLLLGVQIQAQELEVSKIWDQGKHNAFTDLVRFNGKFYCTFRESTGHVPGATGDDGKIRILMSPDGEKWESVALLEKKGYDLRDSKLSITPQGVLMVLMGGSDYDGNTLLGRQNHVSFSNKAGTSFSEPIPTKVDPAIRSNWDWLWRVTWNKGTGYGVIYRKKNKEGSLAYLVKTKNGIDYSLVYALDVYNLPGESTVCFLPDDEMLILMRRDGEGQHGYLGKSKAPYIDWTWNDTGLRLGGPDIIRTSKGKLIAGTRSFSDNAKKDPKTSIYLTSKEGNFKHLLTLPSGGDTSYPGMVEYQDTLWISYYSSHEGKSTIYLAKVPFSYLNKQIKTLNK